MKLNATIVAAGWLLAGASALFARQPAPLQPPSQDHLPAPIYVEGEELLDPTNDEDFWSPPPMPPLPYGFTWDGYYGAEVEHDIYGYRRLNPPPRKTVSCHGLFVGLADSIHVMFSYPTPNRPPPMYCPNGRCGRCVPGKFSYGTHSHCSGDCACQAQPATVFYEPALSAPRPMPTPEPAPMFQPRLTQPRVAPARPLVPPVLIDDSGLPAGPLLTEEPQPVVSAPLPPPPVLTENPPELPPNTELPQNRVPAPATPLPRNKIPARGGGR